MDGQMLAGHTPIDDLIFVAPFVDFMQSFSAT